jgi:hypothetical protein
MKRKTPHPADVRDATRIANAMSFVAHFRKGPVETFREAFPTLAEARAAAERMNAVHGAYGRRAGVYALGADGSVTFVPSAYGRA